MGKESTGKHPGGRPPLYNNCMDFDAMCEMYFEECDSKVVSKYDKDAGAVIEIPQPEPYLKSGLALYLEVCTETMRRYSLDKDCKFCAIIKRNYDKIRNDLEKRAIVNNKQAVGCLFNLKCNHGMVETSKLEVTADVNMEARVRAQVEAELLGEGLEKIGASSHAEDLLKTRT